MRILYVGELSPFTRCEQRLRALCELGHEVLPVELVRDSAGRFDPLRPGLFDRIGHRLGRPRDHARANFKLLLELAHFQPEVLWIEAGACIKPATLEKAREIAPSTRLVLFSEDDLARRANRSSYQSACLGLYDLVVSTKRRHLVRGELVALGARKVHYEHKTYDPLFHRPVRPRPKDREVLGGPLVFIGSYEAPRAAACLALAKAGLPVRVFGNGWQRCRLSHPLLRIAGHALTGELYLRSIASSDICLGFLRQANADQHTDRSVEIPACGGFLMAERSQEHRELFDEGLEAAFFSDHGELVALAGAWLADPERRRSVAARGRLRCIQSGYDHGSALARCLDQLEIREAPQQDVLPEAA